MGNLSATARRVVGVATLAGVLGLVGCMLFAFLIPESRDDSGGELLAYVAGASISLVLGGILAMILHLNTRSSLSLEEKARWRSALLVGGPITVVSYFLRRE